MDIHSIAELAHDDLVEHVFAAAVVRVEPEDLGDFFRGIHAILLRRLIQAAAEARKQLTEHSPN